MQSSGRVFCSYSVVNFILCFFCLLHTAIGQSFDARVNLEEGKDAGQPVHSFPSPASNQIYTFFPAQDADSRAALILFQISEQGVVTTTKPIDYEIGKKNYYDLVAIRRDRGDKEGGVPLSIRITITDTNNFSPTFPASNLYHGRVEEDSPENTTVLGLENCFAEDRDTVGSLTYSISGGNEKGYFKPGEEQVNNRVFLVLKTTNVRIQRDTTPEINLTVRASDGTRFGTTRVTITVLDVNNNSPVFEEKSYSATVNEDTPLMTSVLRVRATDKDVGTNGGIYYYISGSSPWFSVDAITGVMKVVSQLPNQAEVSMNVIARDRGRSSKTASVPVKININLIGDYPPPDSPNPGVNTPPVFPEERYSANVREDFPVGAALLVIHAVDRDPTGRNHSRIRYSLIGDNAFQIDQNSGIVSLRNTLDYSVKNRYDLNVVATDGGQSPQSATTSLVITVQQVDKNRFAPEFQSPTSNKQQRSASVRENSALDTKVGSSITAIDSDGSQRPEGQVVYSIASGSGLAYFKIDESSGDLRTVAALDKEKQSQYNLLIEARDKALYPLKSNLYMIITVTGVEDNNPDFSQPVYYANVPGNAPRNTFVTVIHAIDKDGDTVSYSIENPSSAFTIQTDSGVISTARPLDPADEERSFALSVRATAGNKESQAQVIVTVVSEENSPPTFVNLPYKATVTENLGQIDSLLCLAAKDSQGWPVTYSIASDPDGKFVVDKDSGKNYIKTISYF